MVETAEATARRMVEGGIQQAVHSARARETFASAEDGVGEGQRIVERARAGEHFASAEDQVQEEQWIV